MNDTERTAYGRMISRVAKLEAALRVNVALRVQGERLAAAYIKTRESNRGAIISELIKLFDGPGQREAKRLAEAALNEAWGVEEDGSGLTAQLSCAPLRFWAEVIVGITTVFLCFITLFRPDWIEAICGFDPDQRSGSIEWLIAMASLMVTLALLSAFPWIQGRPS